MGHIGARGTAFANLAALAELFELEEIRIASRRRETREALAHKVRENLGMCARAVATIEEAVHDADIVVEANSAREAAGADRGRLAEAAVPARHLWLGHGDRPETILTASKIVVDDWSNAAPYITAGQVSARDPVTGVDTTGFHRLMLKGKNRLGISLHSRRRMWEFHRRAEERGEPLPAAVTLGIHPLHYMGSMVYAYPPHVRKFEIIGGLFGAPYRLARCGVGDLEVPASAEIVIEGEILPHVKEPEGPFSEFTGYASYRSTQNVFVAHRMRMRRGAMYHSVVSGMSKDHILVSCITREGEILNTLRRNLPNVIGVHVPHTTCGAFMAFIKMKKTAEGEPQQAIMAALGTEFYTKYVIVVDDDVDIFDMNDVMWAVATRVRAERDIVFVPGCKGAMLDPTSDPETYTLTKMGIDATRPIGKDFAERLAISDEQRARVRGILAAAGVQL